MEKIGYGLPDNNSRFDFSPKNDEDKKYLEKLNNLIEVKRRGDWILVGQILNISSKNAENSFYRVHSKHHVKCVEAIESVIDTRSQLINQS